MSNRTAADILAEWIVTRDGPCPPGATCERGPLMSDAEDCIACWRSAADRRVKAQAKEAKAGG